MAVHCRCGSTKYRCNECNMTWCSRLICPKGAQGPGGAPNKCPYCSGYGKSTAHEEDD